MVDFIGSFFPFFKNLHYSTQFFLDEILLKLKYLCHFPTLRNVSHEPDMSVWYCVTNMKIYVELWEISHISAGVCTAHKTIKCCWTVGYHLELKNSSAFFFVISWTCCTDVTSGLWNARCRWCVMDPFSHFFPSFPFFLFKETGILFVRHNWNEKYWTSLLIIPKKFFLRMSKYSTSWFSNSVSKVVFWPSFVTAKWSGVILVCKY